MLPLKHRRLWVALSTILVAIVVWGSLQPNLALPVPSTSDKLQHGLAYFALAVWFTGLYPRPRYGRVAVGLLALGLAIEILQGAMNLGRFAETLDMVANGVGVALGCALALALTGGWARRVETWLARN